MQHIQQGDRVQFNSRKGLITGTITRTDFGRKYYKLDITDEQGHLWGFKCTNSTYEGAHGLKFLGKAKSQELQAATKKRTELVMKKAEFAQKNTDRLWDEQVKEGDTIIVRGPHHNWEAEVDKIDYKNGKVGILKKGAELAQLYGRRVRTHQWIPMNCIIEIKKGTGVKSQNIQEAPASVKTALNKDRYQKELDEKEITQITFSNGEFISSSYALCKTKDPLSHIANYGSYQGIRMYDGPYKQDVKFDESLNLYWIDTGCFD